MCATTYTELCGVAPEEKAGGGGGGMREELPARGTTPRMRTPPLHTYTRYYSIALGCGLQCRRGAWQVSGETWRKAWLQKKINKTTIELYLEHAQSMACGANNYSTDVQNKHIMQYRSFPLLGTYAFIRKWAPKLETMLNNE